MKKAPLPVGEKERLDALNAYQILDTLPEQDFDDITLLAAHICNVPIALISLVDQNRQWFKSKVGLDAVEIPRDIAFCSHAILQKDVFIVPDSRSDERFRNNPLVTGAPHVRFYAGAPLETPSGHRIGTLCVVDYFSRNLTEGQKKALQALARQVVGQLELRNTNALALRSNQLMENSPAAMFCKDYQSGKGVFVEWNRAAENLWGLKKEQVVGKTDYDFFPKEQADFFYQKDRETLETGKALFIEQEPIDIPDKKHLELRTWKVPVSDKTGKPRYLLGISLDITRQVELEKQLLSAKLAAEEALKVKATFLANMSHEIRTPMNGIIGMTNLLMSEAVDKTSMERLKIIQNCGHSLLEIINDVLDFSKLEANKIELEEMPFALHSTIHEVMELFRDHASKKKLALSYRSDNAVPAWLVGDCTRFRQVLTNLISNAIKFTEIGGIEIFSQVEKCDGKKMKVKISVKDTGIGIPEHLNNRLFQSFSQVDASTTRKYGGTGLGLAISRGLCEKMGGTINVESELGKGSTFIFSFQALECEFEQQQVPDTIVPITDETMGVHYPLRILVAEDNPTNQLVTMGFLRKLGYSADVVTSGNEVLTSLERNTYDLIFMDCHMPGMDGFETTKIILEQYKGVECPRIIALTASSMAQDIENCSAAGMHGFLSKPISTIALVNILMECVSAQKHRKAA